MTSRQTEPSLTSLYLGVILVEVVLIVALWLFGRAY
jgi:hypothetical protein